MIKTPLGPTKPDIRREMSGQRKALFKSLRVQYSRLIAQRLENLDSYSKAQDILFFMSLEEEIQTWEMIVRAFQQGKRVYLPIVDRKVKEIRATYLTRLDIEFKKKSYKIQEPDKIFWNFASPEKMDLVLVPGLAFDLSGGRVGFGAGYYDRLLKTLGEDTNKVGVAYDFQLIEAVPQTSMDQKVRMIITEKRTLSCRQSLVEKG